jgi:hypothetical protein
MPRPANRTGCARQAGVQQGRQGAGPHSSQQLLVRQVLCSPYRHMQRAVQQYHFVYIGSLGLAHSGCVARCHIICAPEDSQVRW